MRPRSFLLPFTLVAMLVTAPARAGTGIEFGAIFDLQSESSLTVVGLRSGPVQSGHPGVEVALSLSFASTAVLLGDIDLAVPFGSGGGPVFVARGGASALTGSLVFAGGFNVGVGLIQPLRSDLALRGDVIRRFYQSEGDSFGITALTVGLVWGH